MKRRCLNPRELADAFPDAAPVIRRLLTQAQSSAKAYEDEISELILSVRKASHTEFDEWFSIEVIKLLPVTERYESAIRNARRLQSQLSEYDTSLKPIQSFLEEHIIEDARQVPVQKLLNGHGRRIGRRDVFLCPIHEEKTPSFTVFENNRYYCFGCNASGDAIGLAMTLSGMNFPQAVRYLTNAYE